MASTPRKKKTDSYEPCEVCGAPLDDGQRYCVNCATRRREAGNPTGRYFANAARRTRRASGGGAPQAAPSRGRAAAVLCLLLLPVAVAVGVLVGRGHSSNDDALIAALKSSGGTAAASDTSALASTTTLTSDFTLDKGFTVQLSTIPVGSDQAAADKAKSDATAKGATDVGIIAPADFTLTPAGDGSYVVYSGQFKTKAEAEKALGKLKKNFPSAAVVAVKRNTSGQGAVVAKTQYGDVHKIAGSQITPQQVQQDTQSLNDFGKKTGDSYIQGQKDLPDVVAVGGGGSSTSSVDTSGSGD
jgi:hypothetical protein